jgi:hypothetical protein
VDENIEDVAVEDDVANLFASDFHNTLSPAFTVGVVMVTSLLLLLTVVQVSPSSNEYDTLGIAVVVTLDGMVKVNVPLSNAVNVRYFFGWVIVQPTGTPLTPTTSQAASMLFTNSPLVATPLTQLSVYAVVGSVVNDALI